MIRVLSLGDSYTIGEAVDEHERWPVKLAERLRGAGVDTADPVIVARTGWTTDELCTTLDGAEPGGVFDLVTLLIGVNNQYRGQPMDQYRADMRALLARASGYAASRKSRVIVLSIPDWGATPFAQGRDRDRIAAEIDAFNTIALEEATRTGSRFVDITPASRRAAGEPALVASDGLHPSGAMYAEWARIVAPVALDALAAR